MRGRTDATSRVAVGAVLALLCTALSPAGADAQVQPYRSNDFGGFRNILPPGQAGRVTADDLTEYAVTGTRPPNSSDQLRMYADLVYATPGLKQAGLSRFFKDGSFGVRPDDVERRYSPRPDVTILRDRQFGVPHIYGATRAGAMYGAGYAGAEDRLFFMDALRQAGRGRLSSFAGGSAGNRELDRESWHASPYTEREYQRQIDVADDLLGAKGRKLQEDAHNYVAGINGYIRTARANPGMMPAEYAAIGRGEGPSDWTVRDLIPTAALIAGIFGKGGGAELDSALLLQETRARFGRRRGTRVWRDLRSAEDREAPTTVFKDKQFTYQRPPRRTRRGSVAMPDRGSVGRSKLVEGSTAPSSARTRSESTLGGVLRFPAGNSNALLVSGGESRSGHPLVVFGPQVGYFSPQILYEIDIHGPGIDARGATFPGVGLYVLLGRGRDYAWSATSAGQDIVDTFAVPLCQPGRGRATTRSAYYRFRGRCRRIEVLRQRNSWEPSLADDTPEGSETLRAERTKLGIVEARGTVKGRPVAFTKLRSTYMHEADGALGFEAFNDPAQMKNARDFQQAAAKIPYTFNWFYADDRDIAYFNSGNNPVRARRVNNNLPVHARFEWRNFDPERVTAAYTRFDQHPQTINQRYITSWNNKPARGYRAADDNYSYGTVHRSEPLNDRIRAKLRGGSKMSLPELVDAMETAGTVDLRADKVLPFALRILGRSSDPQLQRAIDQLHAWRRDGPLRRDHDGNGVYEHSRAIAIMDAWWPRLLEAQFKPTLGEKVFERLACTGGTCSSSKLDGMLDTDDEPNAAGTHLGSAYIAGWYGYVEKDLRTILGRQLSGTARVKKRDRFSRTYCGGRGRKRTRFRRCRRVLLASLEEALANTSPGRLYGSDEICETQPTIGPSDPGRKPSNQWCFDAIWHRATGAVEQPLIHWINRPTWQQVVEIQGHRGR